MPLSPPAPRFSTKRFLLCALSFYLLLPMLWLLAGGNFSDRDGYQELFSFLTLAAFSLIPGQFCWFLRNRFLPRKLQRWLAGEYHVFLGSTAVFLLCLHPFLLVLPKLFESGLTPKEAFITMISTPSAPVISGIICWLALLFLGLTAWLRRLLPITMPRWRQLHALTATLALTTGLWHTLLLGRHLTPFVTVFFCIVSAFGGVMLCCSLILSKAESVRTPGERDE